MNIPRPWRSCLRDGLEDDPVSKDLSGHGPKKNPLWRVFFGSWYSCLVSGILAVKNHVQFGIQFFGAVRTEAMAELG